MNFLNDLLPTEEKVRERAEGLQRIIAKYENREPEGDEHAVDWDTLEAISTALDEEMGYDNEEWETDVDDTDINSDVESKVDPEVDESSSSEDEINEVLANTALLPVNKRYENLDRYLSKFPEIQEFKKNYSKLQKNLETMNLPFWHRITIKAFEKYDENVSYTPNSMSSSKSYVRAMESTSEPSMPRPYNHDPRQDPYFIHNSFSINGMPTSFQAPMMFMSGGHSLPNEIQQLISGNQSVSVRVIEKCYDISFNNGGNDTVNRSLAPPQPANMLMYGSSSGTPAINYTNQTPRKILDRIESTQDNKDNDSVICIEKAPSIISIASSEHDNDETIKNIDRKQTTKRQQSAKSKKHIKRKKKHRRAQNFSSSSSSSSSQNDTNETFKKPLPKASHSSEHRDLLKVNKFREKLSDPVDTDSSPRTNDANENKLQNRGKTSRAQNNTLQANKNETKNTEKFYSKKNQEGFEDESFSFLDEKFNPQSVVNSTMKSTANITIGNYNTSHKQSNNDTMQKVSSMQMSKDTVVDQRKNTTKVFDKKVQPKAIVKRDESESSSDDDFFKLAAKYKRQQSLLNATKNEEQNQTVIKKDVLQEVKTNVSTQKSKDTGVEKKSTTKVAEKKVQPETIVKIEENESSSDDDFYKMAAKFKLQQSLLNATKNDELNQTVIKKDVPQKITSNATQNSKNTGADDRKNTTKVAEKKVQPETIVRNEENESSSDDDFFKMAAKFKLQQSLLNATKNDELNQTVIKKEAPQKVSSNASTQKSKDTGADDRKNTTKVAEKKVQPEAIVKNEENESSSDEDFFKMAAKCKRQQSLLNATKNDELNQTVIKKEVPQKVTSNATQNSKNTGADDRKNTTKVAEKKVQPEAIVKNEENESSSDDDFYKMAAKFKLQQSLLNDTKNDGTNQNVPQKVTVIKKPHHSKTKGKSKK